ncbi:Uncharacterised protein g7669 [Pycnogonum litorale]
MSRPNTNALLDKVRLLNNSSMKQNVIDRKKRKWSEGVTTSKQLYLVQSNKKNVHISSDSSTSSSNADYRYTDVTKKMSDDMAPSVQHGKSTDSSDSSSVDEMLNVHSVGSLSGSVAENLKISSLISSEHDNSDEIINLRSVASILQSENEKLLTRSDGNKLNTIKSVPSNAEISSESEIDEVSEEIVTRSEEQCIRTDRLSSGQCNSGSSSIMVDDNLRVSENVLTTPVMEPSKSVSAKSKVDIHNQGGLNFVGRMQYQAAKNNLLLMQLRHIKGRINQETQLYKQLIKSLPICDGTSQDTDHLSD